jgi:transcriptional regulator with XRE-family HTH domain
MHNNNDFTSWLLKQIDKRGWNQSELARRAEISHGRISQVLSGDKPGADFCVAIARALNMSAYYVLGQAGIVPLEPEETVNLREANRLFAQLSDDEQEILLAQMRALAERKHANPKPTVETS